MAGHIAFFDGVDAAGLYGLWVTNGTAAGESKLLWPSLEKFYSPCFEIAYALLRVIIGYILFMHGWVKFGAGVAAVAGAMAKNGLEPASAFAYAAIFLETVGAACLVIGLFTRFFAAALAEQTGRHRIGGLRR